MANNRPIYWRTLEQNWKLKRELKAKRRTIIVLVLLAGLLGVLLFFCKPIKAGGFVEVGKSNFIRPAEFIFWQGPYPHEFQTDSNYFRVGYEKGPWRISWFDLGHYKTKEEAAAAYDHAARTLGGGFGRPNGLANIVAAVERRG